MYSEGIPSGKVARPVFSGYATEKQVHPGRQLADYKWKGGLPAR